MNKFFVFKIRRWKNDAGQDLRDLEKRILERAYYIYTQSGCQDSEKNYYAAEVHFDQFCSNMIDCESKSHHIFHRLFFHLNEQAAERKTIEDRVRKRAYQLWDIDVNEKGRQMVKRTRQRKFKLYNVSRFLH